MTVTMVPALLVESSVQSMDGKQRLDLILLFSETTFGFTQAILVKTKPLSHLPLLAMLCCSNLMTKVFNLTDLVLFLRRIHQTEVERFTSFNKLHLGFIRVWCSPQLFAFLFPIENSMCPVKSGKQYSMINAESLYQ